MNSQILGMDPQSDFPSRNWHCLVCRFWWANATPNSPLVFIQKDTKNKPCASIAYLVLGYLWSSSWHCLRGGSLVGIWQDLACKRVQHHPTTRYYEIWISKGSNVRKNHCRPTHNVHVSAWQYMFGKFFPQQPDAINFYKYIIWIIQLYHTSTSSLCGLF